MSAAWSSSATATRSGLARAGPFFLSDLWIGDPVNAELIRCWRLVWADSARLLVEAGAYTAVQLRAWPIGTSALDGWPAPSRTIELQALDVGS